MSILVTYNGSSLSPTPIVSEDYEVVHYNGTNWGNVLNITLQGLLTGITSTGNIYNITNIFSPQFGNLQVYEEPSNKLIYNWSNVIITDITFPQSHYYSGTTVPYTIKAKSYNVPSGVIDPSNLYTFTQGEDGIVTVNHNISARGIKNSTNALGNVISFIQNFTGKQPFSACASSFIPNGSGILISLNERVDRASATYSVTEIWQYNTGVSGIYTQLSNLSITDAIDQSYLTLDYEVKFQGSPIQNNLTNLSNSVTGFNLLADIGNLGIATGLLIQTSSEINRNSGEASIDFKCSFYSGYSTQDLTGFFDYNVSLSKDLLIPKETWKIDGDFICRGPISYQYQQLNNFKSVYGGNWRNYFIGLITGSPIYTGFHTTGNLLSSNPILNIQENTGLATFHASLSVTDGGEPSGLQNLRYNVSSSPSKWAFELMPAANIEGHYIVQDLQMKTQNKTSFSLNAESQFPYLNLSGLSGFLTQLSNLYINTGFMIESQYNTGITDISCENNWIGQGNFDTGILNIKVIGSNNFNWNRASGYSFGF